MSEETKEDIVREMRMGSTGDMPCAYIVGMPDTIEEFLCGGKVPKINIKRVTVEELADRFEAAFKRESVGNAAAMREALVEAIGETCAGCKRDCDDCMNLKSGWMKKAKAALSAPARNCDLKECSTDDGMMSAHERFCESWHDDGKWCSECPYKPKSQMMTCREKWLLAPAAERKGEGDEQK